MDVEVLPEGVSKMLSHKEQETVDSIARRFRDLMNNPEMVNDVANSLLEEFIDEITLGVVFEVHRSASLGLLEPEVDQSGEDGSKFKIVEDPGLDVFGQPPVVKKFQDCICPSCNRSLAASRFAPHLEKCMGMGRNSSRIASRRIANNSKDTSTIASDDEDDVDWNDRRRKRRDRSNGNAKRPSKNQKTERRNGEASASLGAAASEGPVGNSNSSSSDTATSTTLEAMRLDERRTLLSQICGVISEHTRKLCTRSLRCPQHSDDQRRLLRTSYLVDDTNFQAEIQVNVESLGLESDDVLSGLSGSVGPLGGSLGFGSLSRGSWETERSNTSSPLDSVSVSSSSSSKKREKASPGKNSGHKKKSSKHSSHEL